MDTTTDTIRPDCNSDEYLEACAESSAPGTSAIATILLGLDYEHRAIARSEMTYRLNTEPGWRPSAVMADIAIHLRRGLRPYGDSAGRQWDALIPA